MKLKRIITHSGKAHRDETLAIALLLTECKNKPPIYRRNPTKEEIKSTDIAVIDIGAQYDEDKLNFDHHQFPQDHEPTCSLTLILKYLGLLQQGRMLWPWLATTEIHDSKGPAYFRDLIDIDPKDSPKIASPIEEGFLRAVKDTSKITSGDPCYILLEGMGKYLRKHAERLYPRMKKFRDETTIKQVDDIVVLDTTNAFPVDEDPTFGSELYCRNHAPDVELIISNDNRGPGLSLYRRIDRRIDLYKIAGEEGVEFAHKNGFIAKVDPEADIDKLIKQAKI